MVFIFLQEALGLSADEANVLNDSANHGFTMEVFNEYTCQMQQFCLSGVGGGAEKMMMCENTGVDNTSTDPTTIFADILSETISENDISNENFQENLDEWLGLSGQDWFFDEDFWNDPDLSFLEQELPSYEDFLNCFPKNDDGTWMYGADNIYELAGGDVLGIRMAHVDVDPNPTDNTCALKMSIALNCAGINIPNIPGPTGTIEGSDGKFHFLNAAALSEWLMKTFPSFICYGPGDHSNPDIQTLLGSKQGFLVSIYGGFGGAGSTSGHADIYTGQSCASYFDCGIRSTSQVYWWELP